MNIGIAFVLFIAVLAVFRFIKKDYALTKKQNFIAYALVASVLFASVLLARSIFQGISIVDQIETMALAAEKWGNDCTWLP